MTKTEYIFVTPPEQWMQEYDSDPFRGHTNEDLIEHWLHQEEVIEQHNLDKRYLQMWSDTFGDDELWNN